MRAIACALFVFLVIGPALGCGTSSGGGTSSTASGGRTVDGLVEAEIDMPGVLFVREDHAIGSYDAFLIAPAGIAYQRGSRRLEPQMEEEFKAHLEQSLFDLSEEAGIPIARSPAACVMLVGVGLVNVDLERSGSAKVLGEMTLAMEFRDSLSSQPLLRYATQNRIEKDVGGSDRSARLRQSFDEMLGRMNVASALEAAGLGDQAIRGDCQGKLAEIGRGAVTAGQ